MIDRGKQNLLGVLVDAVDYDAVVVRIVAAAQGRRAFGATALAVHGVMEGYSDPEIRHRLNRLELVTPDGQAVRWALDALHGTDLPDRCYGPILMRRVCTEAARADLPVYLYGSTAETVGSLGRRLCEQIGGLRVAGSTPSLFRTVPSERLDEIAATIVESGARITFVGLGCPRQEVFVYEMRLRLSMPVVAVGAAFDYHAGVRREPPARVQDLGLQWLWRLLSEPRRLSGRYARTNPRFVFHSLRQRLGWVPPLDDTVEPRAETGHA